MTGGTFEIGPQNGALSIHTSRAGVAGKMGHDLRIEVTEWRGTVTMTPDNPAECSVRVVANSPSLRVREGSGGAKALTDSDRAEIEKTTHEKMLRTSKHPEIVFESTSVSGVTSPAPPTTAVVDGQLSIFGEPRPLRLDMRVEPDGAGYHVSGEGIVRQTDWGIKPYSAFMGALKVKDEVKISFDVKVGPS